MARWTTGFNIHTLADPRKRYGFWIDDEQAAGLKFVKERDACSRASGKWRPSRTVSALPDVSPCRQGGAGSR